MPDDVTNIKIAMGKFEQKLINTDKTVSRIECKIDEFIKSTEKKFADKWVEKVLIWGGTIIGGCLIIALMALVLK